MSYLNKCPRVLHIMSGYGGGISAFIRNKAPEFNDRDIPFDVITFDEVSEEFNHLIENTGGRVYKVSNPKKSGFKTFYKEVDKIMRNLPKNTLIPGSNSISQCSIFLKLRSFSFLRIIMQSCIHYLQ